MELIYHYTSGTLLEKILTDEKLIVSEFEKRNKIKPASLWLSLNPIWENTATKMINENGISRHLTKEEQHQQFGLIRFVMEFKKDKLCSWAKYKHISNTPFKVYNSLEQIGIEQGANPDDWYASFKNISIYNCITIEKWNGCTWEDMFENMSKMAK